MEYKNIHRGIFKSRPNRFIAYVEIYGQEEVCHVKNTGRCRELLIPGSIVYLEESDNPNRKTRYDLVAVEKNGKMFNIDSQAPNKVAQEWLESQDCDILFNAEEVQIKPECKYKNSRFDFFIETEDRKIFMEVKGVTLEEEGRVRFPDAPSERAVKHLEELMEAKSEGYEAYVLFVIQMEGPSYFTPNEDTHPKFCEILRTAEEMGVKVLAYDCLVTESSMTLKTQTEVRL